MDDTTQPTTAQPAGPAVPGPGRTAQPIDPRPGQPVQAPLASRVLRLVLVAAGGLGLLLVGLVVDAVLHARDPATRAKLSRPVDGACPEGQVFRRTGEMMHVWFTGDLASAFARRAPLAALRTAAGGAVAPTP